MTTEHSARRNPMLSWAQRNASILVGLAGALYAWELCERLAYTEPAWTSAIPVGVLPMWIVLAVSLDTQRGAIALLVATAALWGVLFAVDLGWELTAGAVWTAVFSAGLYQAGRAPRVLGAE